MIRFGIIGAGNIAHRFLASLDHEPRARLVAAACRSQSKAAAFLAETSHSEDAKPYGDYDELLADPNVDAVYIGLPHAYHHEWALKALRAGKAVLCEKPAMLTADQMREVAQVSRSEGRLFMEAMKPRFVSLYAQVERELPRIGRLTSVEATLCNSMMDLVEGTGTYHLTPGPGAGVLLDCGTYCASWLAAFCPGDLRLVSANVECIDGIDVYADAHFCANGVEAGLECAFDRAKLRTATLVGECGRIVVEELHRPQRATVHVDGEPPKVLDVPYEVDDFYGEIHHFVGLLEEGRTESPIMSLDDSIACATILDTIREAAS
ncbi:MAG: Gfo/Idh/MocA family oxidoreductase [Coriobacteriales bacterium]|nr:Gfo/Idh/MocA family oxidoreductase [Coriobacteriales bacterium]